mmetsp:Transcript_49420/g.141655  ORF Transcript_49420/g.141655 Transcript_49420/m.141655 type:complete len:527 (-) Transcript_49420:251-1831(-)
MKGMERVPVQLMQLCKAATNGRSGTTQRTAHAQNSSSACSLLVMDLLPEVEVLGLGQRRGLAVPGEAEADALLLHVVGRVVPPHHRLAQDEQLRADRFGEIHGHEHGLAIQILPSLDLAIVVAALHALRCPPEGAPGLPSAAAEGRLRRRRGELCPGVVARAERKGEVVALKLDLQLGALAQAMALQRCGVPQHLEDLGEGSGRDGDQGGARVHNGGAAAILAELHGYAIHLHGLDLDQPVAEVGMVDRSPSQRFVDMAPGPATNSQLASFLGVLGQEDREGVRGRCADPAGQARHDVGEVELGRLRQTGQAEAQDSVKLEILERLLGHLRGRDDPHAHARRRGRGRLPHVCHAALRRGRLRGVVGTRDLQQPCGLLGLCNLNKALHHLLGHRRFAHADLLLDENAGDLPRAEAHRDLVAGCAEGHRGAVVVDVLRSRGCTAAVSGMDLASLGVAPRTGKDQVATARVKHDPEGNARRANLQRAPIGALVVRHLAVFLDSHLLPREVQGDQGTVTREAVRSEVLPS